MEYVLRVATFVAFDSDDASLNPCFSGICSQRIKQIIMKTRNLSLNPCFSGICSQRKDEKRVINGGESVLILVLVEYVLRVPI